MAGSLGLGALGSFYSVSDESLSSVCPLDPLWIPGMLGITDSWVSLMRPLALSIPPTFTLSAKF